MAEKKRSMAQPDGSWPLLIVNSAREVFQLMVGSDVKHIAHPTDNPSGSVSALVGMAGVISAVVRFRCAPETAKSIAAKMLGGSAGAAENAAIADAIGEIANMVAGNFKSKITELTDGCVLSVPTIVTGENYEVHPVGRAARIETCLEYEQRPVWITMDISG
jgi:chemotaxis protein CheX